MTLMEERTRKRMMLEARRHGGIAIPHLKLQVHQNGAKFPISKVYIDDEQLDQDTKYTIIIIPEAPMISCLILSHFDKRKGPTVSRVAGDTGIGNRLQTLCSTVMDAMSNTGFFESTVEGLNVLSYHFRLKSEWQRTMQEELLISLATDTRQNALVADAIEAIFADFAEKMKKEPGIFKAFHDERDHESKPADIQDIVNARKKVADLFVSVHSAMLDVLNPRE